VGIRYRPSLAHAAHLGAVLLPLLTGDASKAVSQIRCRLSGRHESFVHRCASRAALVPFFLPVLISGFAESGRLYGSGWQSRLVSSQQGWRSGNSQIRRQRQSLSSLAGVGLSVAPRKPRRAGCWRRIFEAPYQRRSPWIL